MVGLSNHQGAMSSLSVMFWLYRSGSVLSTHLQADCNRPFVITRRILLGVIVHSRLRHHGCSRIVSASIMVSMSMVVLVEKGISRVSCWKSPNGIVVTLWKKAVLLQINFVYASEPIICIRANHMHQGQSYGPCQLRQTLWCAIPNPLGYQVEWKTLSVDMPAQVHIWFQECRWLHGFYLVLEWWWIRDEDIAIRHCINLALLQQGVQFHHKVWVDWNIIQFILQ